MKIVKTKTVTEEKIFKSESGEIEGKITIVNNVIVGIIIKRSTPLVQLKGNAIYLNSKRQVEESIELLNIMLNELS